VTAVVIGSSEMMAVSQPLIRNTLCRYRYGIDTNPQMPRERYMEDAATKAGQARWVFVYHCQANHVCMYGVQSSGVSKYQVLTYVVS
jgi:hypothetical protein